MSSEDIAICSLCQMTFPSHEEILVHTCEELKEEKIEEIFEHSEIIANEQLGPGWRLPTLGELYSLVCKKCEKGKKFDSVIFPNTDPRAYWTGEKNSMSKGSYWTVNFFTGHKFGRFYPQQDMAVRLVRDR